jgi:hypothetical protein
MNPNRIHWTYSVLLAGAGLLFAASVEAAGYGAYFEYGRAMGEIEHFDYDTNKFGAGFVVDTNVAKNRLFNYRFTLGYQHSKREFNNGDEGDFNGVTMNHAFGFGLYRSPALRLWAGPAIRLSADVLHEDLDDVAVVNLSAGGGLQLGLNAHAGNRFSLAISFAYQYLYVGEIVVWDDYDDADRFDGRNHLCTLNVSFLFRSAGDRYEPAKGRRADR